MDDHIICLVGPSGSGKTTVAKDLESRYNVIQSCTTRPKRADDEWGHTFVSEYPHEDVPKTIAYTKFNGYEYWATEDHYKGKGISIYIIDPHGDQMLRSTIDCPITTIFLSCSQHVLLDRMLTERGKEKALERIDNDQPIFACVKCDYVIDAGIPLKNVLLHAHSIIEHVGLSSNG